MLKKLFGDTGMDVNTFGQYSANETDVFQDFVDNGMLQISDSKEISARTAFKIAFPNCNIQKTSMKTVSAILKNMFNVKTPENTNKRKDGKYIYEAKPEAIAETFYTQSIK